MLTVKKLRKMLDQLESEGKIDGNTPVVSCNDEFGYIYSPKVKDRAELVLDTSEDMKDAKRQLNRNRKILKRMQDPVYAKVGRDWQKKRVKKWERRVSEYKKLGKICLRIY